MTTSPLKVEEEREKFEEWIKSRFLDGYGHYNTWQGKFVYTHTHVQAMWEGWQTRALLDKSS